MIYVITLIVCLFLVWKYDFRGKKTHKDRWFKGLLLWYIVISALQYYVGVDIAIYIDKYSIFREPLNLDSFVDKAGERVQPGWLILTWFCKLFTDDFILMKIIQAIFFNIAVFTFFKREAKYVFLCIFFFSVTDYLVCNFNVLRQSYSIAFGLYAVSALKNDKYLKYGLFVILAFMFHNSALLLLLLPIIKFFKPNRYTKPLALGTVALVIYVLFKVNMESLAYEIVGSGMMGESGSDMAMLYLNNDKLGAREGAKFTFHALLVFIVVCYYISKKREFYWGGYGVAYLFFLLLSTMMPILWRYRLFFDIPYYVMLSQLIVEFPLKRFKQVKYAFYIGSLVIYMYFPMKDYFYKAPNEKIRYIDQYYPYHSIFDPVKEERD